MNIEYGDNLRETRSTLEETFLAETPRDFLLKIHSCIEKNLESLGISFSAEDLALKFSSAIDVKVSIYEDLQRFLGDSRPIDAQLTPSLIEELQLSFGDFNRRENIARVWINPKIVKGGLMRAYILSHELLNILLMILFRGDIEDVLFGVVFHEDTELVKRIMELDSANAIQFGTSFLVQLARNIEDALLYRIIPLLDKNLLAKLRDILSIACIGIATEAYCIEAESLGVKRSYKRAAFTSALNLIALEYAEQIINFIGEPETKRVFNIMIRRLYDVLNKNPKELQKLITSYYRKFLPHFNKFGLPKSPKDYYINKLNVMCGVLNAFFEGVPLNCESYFEIKEKSYIAALKVSVGGLIKAIIEFFKSP